MMMMMMMMIIIIAVSRWILRRTTRQTRQVRSFLQQLVWEGLDTAIGGGGVCVSD